MKGILLSEEAKLLYESLVALTGVAAGLHGYNKYRKLNAPTEKEMEKHEEKDKEHESHINNLEAKRQHNIKILDKINKSVAIHGQEGKFKKDNE
jgi:hypothetical protein